MRYILSMTFLAVLLSAASPSGFSQLRNLSEYSRDCIEFNQTGFVLRDKNVADYNWTTQWTHTTANAYPDQKAMLIWYFKDGLKAYLQQGEFIGDLGQITGYLLTGKSANLEDVHRKKIQPMTLSNYPVKVELWIGEIEDSTGFAPEILLDRVCFDAQSIELNQVYHFSSCK
jgi:hypothetical protein